MEKVDLVIVGAEGVVESGGVINKVRKSTGVVLVLFKISLKCKNNHLIHLFFLLDWYLSDGSLLQSTQQTILCGGRKF